MLKKENWGKIMCRKIAPVLLAILALGSVATTSSAAEILLVGTSSETQIITVTGTLNQGDDDVFRRIISTAKSGVVVMNSGGGSLTAGLEIGRAIKLRGFATAVTSNTLCASACALAWLAGTPRMLDDASKIGFHAAYKVMNGKPLENGAANALVGAYLNQLGLSDKAILYVTTAPPEGIEWLDIQKAQSIGISFQQLQATVSNPPRLTQQLPYDPISTATAFYTALAQADGETAAAIVVPEKRGKGPFNEKSIHAFFSAMSEPLRIISMTLRGRDEVMVSYEYTTDKGRACRGRADVRTVYGYGRTLISGIKALDGC
ncbi:hypothetical protein NOJ05_19560 [Neorhizobium galegae]|uniref:COG3904 family protein n=1 Tax=Neorhizobium galegae TaxID=399 RepID=UPI002104001A|nr:hypothetical protein [Neorhizobium galegae]MCQ1779409.1 hypothetical protein [Neorhizobium galegae]MCQ1795569.1 hypothetical protein [Neorhizobium galegae]